MKAVVFLGPSHAPDAEIAGNIEILPPAAAGDIYRATRRGVDLIALIDARFQDLETVRHKEILYALERGIHVWGAASMGALRAAECEAYGMRGFGKIFEMYRTGAITDDSEVALVYQPAALGYAPLSEPLVNIRATLSLAVAEGLFSSDESAQILDVAQVIFYPELTWQSLAAGLDDTELAARVNALARRRIDQKRRDASELLAAVSAACASGLSHFCANFELQRTHHWRALEAQFMRAEDALTESDAAILDELRLKPLRYRELLLQVYGKSLLSTDIAAVKATSLDSFREDLCLHTVKDFRNWLDANQTSADAIASLLIMDDAFEEALERAMPGLAGALLDELRLEDEYRHLLERADKKSRAVSDVDGFDFPDAFALFDLQDLLDWFGARHRLTLALEDVDALTRSIGLPDRAALHRLLRREFEFERIGKIAA